VVVIVILVAGLFYLLTLRQGGGEQDGEPFVEPALEAPAGDRAVLLVFPALDGIRFVTEQRQLPSWNLVEIDLLTLMSALCEGPSPATGAISALPAGTRPLAAFYDQAEASVVVDFSRELVTNHPGGSAAENGTLTSIMRTIALNFPEVRWCTLLVDGAPTETLAGHLTLDQPFSPRRWL